MSTSTSSRFGQDGDRRRRGVDAPLRLGLRHALDAMDAGFEFQPREDAAARDLGDDLLVAAHRAFARREHFDASSLALRHSADTCGRDRRRTAPPRRRRCRRGLREWRFSRRPHPWAGAPAADCARARRAGARPRRSPLRRARACRRRSPGSASSASMPASSFCSSRQSRIAATTASSSANSRDSATKVADCRAGREPGRDFVMAAQDEIELFFAAA